VETVRHKDKRKNIPTEELRDFVADEENQPRKVLYPRDPSLDPQLVWKGKDEQDSRPLEVPAVPIYIQDKIHPQAIIEDFRRSLECGDSSPLCSARGGDRSSGSSKSGDESPHSKEMQLSLFDDFNGLPEKDGRVVVEIRGVEVCDPTTGEIRSSTTDDIACWFIDTNYNEESFFVRHAYFTGADQPYEKLKRALRAETDEAAWSALYSTTSRPFDPPETGRIAVKVINHYGDEVLKVYEVE
jgi:hypothetical protein